MVDRRGLLLLGVSRFVSDLLRFGGHRRFQIAILIMVSLMHSASSAICDVVRFCLSIISRIRKSFEGESLGAMLLGLILTSSEVVGVEKVGNS